MSLKIVEAVVMSTTYESPHKIVATEPEDQCTDVSYSFRALHHVHGFPHSSSVSATRHRMDWRTPMRLISSNTCSTRARC